MEEWVCRTCGATYSEEPTPCLQCASDDVRHVDDDEEDYRSTQSRSAARTADEPSRSTRHPVTAAGA